MKRPCLAVFAALVASACTPRARTVASTNNRASATEGAPVSARSSGASDAREPSPVALSAPSVADRVISAATPPTRWTLPNGVSVEHRRFALASTVSVRLVVRGQSSEPAAGLGLRDALRLAAALENGATRRNAAPLFVESLEQLGAELRVDAGRQGLVLSLDVASRNASAAIRRLGELASEPSPSREIPTFGDFVARRLSSMRARTEATDALVLARRSAVESLRALEAPWSPREWSDAAATFSWGPAATDDPAPRALVRSMFRGGAMTLIVAGDISLEDARSALAERWTAVARGPGLAVAPLEPPAPSADAATTWRASMKSASSAGLALAFSLSSDGRPASVVALRAVAPVLERCASRDVRVALYDDPRSPVLSVASTLASTSDLVAKVDALAGEPTRALASPCAAAEFVTARNALIDLIETDDSARWADARAWARHDAIEPIDDEATIAALAALDLERARAVFRTSFSTVIRAVGLAAPAGQEMALCAVTGVREVRVSNAVRPCSR